MGYVSGRIERDGDTLARPTRITLHAGADASGELGAWQAIVNVPSRRLRAGEKYTLVLEDGRRGEVLADVVDPEASADPSPSHLVLLGTSPPRR